MLWSSRRIQGCFRRWVARQATRPFSLHVAFSSSSSPPRTSPGSDSIRLGASRRLSRSAASSHHYAVPTRALHSRMLASTAPRRRQALAVTVIARAWRAARSRLIVSRLAEAKARLVAEAVGREHAVVYAIRLQCWIRRTLLAPARVRSAIAARRERVSTILQRWWRRQSGRRLLDSLFQQSQEAADAEYDVELREFAATMIQKTYRGHATRRSIRQRHYFMWAVTCIQRSWRLYRAFQLAMNVRDH